MQVNQYRERIQKLLAQHSVEVQRMGTAIKVIGPYRTMTVQDIALLTRGDLAVLTGQRHIQMTPLTAKK